MNFRRRTLALAGMTAWLGQPLNALAQRPVAFPSGPVKLLVPFASGGIIDVTARWVGLQLGQVLNKPVHVENRPGASGALAAAALKTSPADGHTILIATNGLEVMNPFLFKKQAYEVSDLKRISIISESSIALVVPKKLGVTTLKELTAYVKGKGDGATYGSWGQGSSGHIFGSLLAQAMGVKMLHVPYKGEMAALMDLSRGDLDLSWASPNGARAARDRGDVVVIAVTGGVRSPGLPDVATFAEQGLESLKLGLYTVAYAPKDTPLPVVDALQQALVQVLAQPETKERFATMGQVPVGSTPAQFDTMIAREAPIWREAIRASGASLD